MASAVAAIIAVAGTLLGSSLTFLFQRRSAARSEARAFSGQVRGERLAAYSAFVTAVTLFRRGQLEWMHRHLGEGPDREVTIAARTEAYRLRGPAQAALSHVELVAFDDRLVGAAGKTLESCEPMYKASDMASLDAMNEEAKALMREFVSLASAEVRQPV